MLDDHDWLPAANTVLAALAAAGYEIVRLPGPDETCPVDDSLVWATLMPDEDSQVIVTEYSDITTLAVFIGERDETDDITPGHARTLAAALLAAARHAEDAQ